MATTSQFFVSTIFLSLQTDDSSNSKSKLLSVSTKTNLSSFFMVGPSPSAESVSAEIVFYESIA